MSCRCWINHCKTNWASCYTLTLPQNSTCWTSWTLIEMRSSAVAAIGITWLADWHTLVQVESSPTFNYTNRFTRSCILQPWSWRTNRTISWTVSAISAIHITRLAEILSCWIVTERTCWDAWTLEKLKRRIAWYTIRWLRAIAGVAGTWAIQTLPCRWVVVHIVGWTSWQTASVWVKNHTCIAGSAGGPTGTSSTVAWARETQSNFKTPAEETSANLNNRVVSSITSIQTWSSRQWKTSLTRSATNSIIIASYTWWHARQTYQGIGVTECGWISNCWVESWRTVCVAWCISWGRNHHTVPRLAKRTVVAGQTWIATDSARWAKSIVHVGASWTYS